MGKYPVQPTYINIDCNLIWKISLNIPHGKFLLHHMSQSKPSNPIIKRLRLFQNNNLKFLIIKNWDTWQHITYSHCSPKKSHLSCK